MIYMDKKQSKNGAQFMPYNFLIKSSIVTGFCWLYGRGEDSGIVWYGMVGMRTVVWYSMV